jgi:hypothetical protein
MGELGTSLSPPYGRKLAFAVRVLAGVTLPLGHPGWVDPLALAGGSFGIRSKYVEDWKVLYESNLDL